MNFVSSHSKSPQPPEKKYCDLYDLQDMSKSQEQDTNGVSNPSVQACKAKPHSSTTHWLEAVGRAANIKRIECARSDDLLEGPLGLFFSLLD